VKEDGDGNADMSELEGCHDTESEAEDQIAALEASEDDRSVVEVLADTLDSKRDVHRVLARVVNRAAEDVDLMPPSAVVNAAEAALEAKEEYDDLSDCGSGRGEQRAEQIVGGDLSPADFVTRENGTPIPAYLTSHEEDVSAEGTPTGWTEEEWTDGCGNVQYALWGGTGTGTGLAWAQQTANAIAREMDEDEPYPNASNRIPTAMPQREMSLSDRVSAVRMEFYNEYDDPDGTGAWWYVEEVYEARIIAMADHEGGTLYEIGYEMEEAPDGVQVTFAPEQEWTVVVQEYVPAEEEMERLRSQKRELTGAGTAEEPGCGCGQRAEASDLSEGTIVTWGPDNAPRYGAVQEVHTSGEVTSDTGADDETTMEASDDNPVIEIQHWSYDSEEEEWMETNTVTVHRPDNLEILDELPERSLQRHARGAELADEMSDMVEDMAEGGDMSTADVREELADAAGISTSTVASILSGEIQCPPIERLEGFAQVLDVPTEELIETAREDGCSYGGDGNRSAEEGDFRRFRERVTDGEGALDEDILPSDNYRSTSTDFRQADDETYTFEINNDEVDRHRTIIDPEGGDVDHFRENNPVVLWQHGIDPMRGELPIGRVVQLNYNESRNAWIARIRFFEDEFSQTVRRMVDEGFLNMSSIQFDPNDSEMRETDAGRVRAYTDWELLEVSIVSIGSNRGALHERMLREMAPGENEVYEEMQDAFIEFLQGFREVQKAQVEQMRALATASAAPDEVPAGATAPAGAKDGPASERNGDTGGPNDDAQRSDLTTEELVEITVRTVLRQQGRL